MTKMGFAASAHDLGPLHAMRMIRGIKNASLADRLVETRPAATALELGIAPEKRVAAYGTIVSANLFGMFKGTASRSFGSLQPGYGIDILREDLYPLVFGEIDLGGVMVGIYRVGLFFCSIHDVLFQIVGGLRISTLLKSQRH
jgi:hypothetical protein